MEDLYTPQIKLQKEQSGQQKLDESACWQGVNNVMDWKWILRMDFLIKVVGGALQIRLLAN